MDAAWIEAVEGEKMLDHPDLPSGFEMPDDYLVRPFGSFEDPLLVLSSYPTAKPGSSVQINYGMVNDISNQCKFMLYAKLGYHISDLRQNGGPGS
jgi:hypothetical protein